MSNGELVHSKGDGATEKAPFDSKSGEYIAAGQMGSGGVNDPHSDEADADVLRGKPEAVDISAIDPNWVLQRLVKEANDFGARTRQSARIKALELIGQHFAMFTRVVKNEDPLDGAFDNMPPWERRKKILELASKMASDPNFAHSVSEAMKNGVGKT